LSGKHLGEEALAIGTLSKMRIRFKFFSAVHTPGLSPDTTNDRSGMFQDGAGYSGFPGKLQSIHFDAGQVADVQLNLVNLPGPGPGYLLMGQIHYAQDDGHFVHK
jgi:hypothetical protein